jgi:hypothetical protein
MQTVARILFTLTALGYGLGTIKADFNKTHATNAAWTPHARFHVVWQILSYSGIGLIALYLIWADGPMALQRLYLVAAFGVAIYGAFFAAAFARPIYKGTLYDQNGYLPFKPPLGPQHWRWDANVTVFTIMSAILAAAILALLAS